jgi:transcriptional regulator with XRE-family HTH domain
MTMTRGTIDRSEVIRLAPDAVLTGRGSRILGARLLRVAGALIVGLSFLFTQVADAAGAEHQADVGALAPAGGDPSAGGNGGGDAPPASPPPSPGVAPAPGPIEPPEEPAPPAPSEPPDVAPAPGPIEPPEEPAPPAPSEPPDVAPAPEPPDVAPAPVPTDPSEAGPTEPTEPPVVNSAPTEATDPPEPTVDESAGPKASSAGSRNATARAADSAGLASEPVHVSRPIASAHEPSSSPTKGNAHPAPARDRARPTNRSRAPAALALDQPSIMRAQPAGCRLDGIEDCADVASASAASVIAFAGPRIPTTVSVAVEFGKAGQGWAGAIVFNLWLRRQLRERRMSQRQLAHLSGVNHSTISRLLAGDRIPSLETATKLARALRVPNEDIAAELGFVTGRPAMPMQRVEAALRGDEGLDESDVRVLMEAYIARRRRLSLKSVDSATAVVGSARDSGPDPPA